MSLTDENDKKEKDIEHYPTPGSIRYITFIQQDGKRKALAYSLLPEIDFDPGDEHNTIVMTFPTRTVKLTGHGLVELSEKLTAQTVKSIQCVDKRYFAMDEREISIIKIEIL